MHRIAGESVIYSRVLVLVCGLLTLMYAAPVLASPIIATNVSGKYGRLTFNWDARKAIEASSNGNRITIVFPSRETININQITAGLSPYVTSAVMSADGRTLTLNTNRPYPIRSFLTMKGAGIDIKQLNRQSLQAFPEAKAPKKKDVQEVNNTQTPDNKAKKLANAPTPIAKPSPPKAEVKVAETPLPVAKPEIPKQEPQKQNTLEKKEVAHNAMHDKKLANEKKAESGTTKTVIQPPKAEEKEVAAASESQEKTSDTPKVDATATSRKVAPSKTEPQAEKNASKEVDNKPKKQEQVKQKSPDTQKTHDTEVRLSDGSKPQEAKQLTTEINQLINGAAEVVTPTPTQSTSLSKPVSQPSEDEVMSDSFVIQVQPDKVNTRIFFPWGKRISAASFMRDNILWVVFNDKAEIELDLFESILPAAILGIDEIEHPTHTILRMRTDGTTNASMSQPKHSNKWILSLSPYKQIPAEPVAIEWITDVRTPNIFVPVLEYSPPIRITDPTIGDDILVTPFYNPGVGIFPQRTLREVVILQTAQGLAVLRKADNALVKEVRNGLRITAKGGLVLSKDLPELTLDELEVAEGVNNVFFPYEQWRAEDDDFTAAKQALERKVWSATDIRASSLRLKLAQLYLAYGMGQEALGIIEVIREDDPNFFTAYKLSALRGGANFLMYRMHEALQDFSAKELKEEKEAVLWRNAINLYLNRDRSRFAFIDNDRAYISKYPPLMRQRLALLAAENYIDRRDHRRAYKSFDSLSKDNLLNDIEEEVDYLLARMSAEKGQIETAVTIWKKLMDSNDRFLRARSELAMVSALYTNGNMTRAEAIEHLDRLRIVWRGDALELQVLNLVGQLFIDDGRYLDGMRAMRELVTQFPESEAALENARYMSELFQFLYLEDGANRMPPLKALALFYEFRELTPIGQKGDLMIQALADRLAAVDLFDRAAELLEHQVKFRLEGEDRSRIGARLALIYLLNREAKDAFDTLKLTGFGQNPETLQIQRNHLTAMALSELGQLDRAVRILADDTTQDGKRLRLNIFWRNQDWQNVIKTGEEILASRNNLTAPLSKEESEALVQLAIAYVFERNEQQLAYLRDYFTPLLEDSPSKDTFLYITDDSGPLDPDNFQRVANDISNIENFLDSYRQKVADKGLSEAIN